MGIKQIEGWAGDSSRLALCFRGLDPNSPQPSRLDCYLPKHTVSLQSVSKEGLSALIICPTWRAGRAAGTTRFPWLWGNHTFLQEDFPFLESDLSGDVSSLGKEILLHLVLVLVWFDVWDVFA